MHLTKRSVLLLLLTAPLIAAATWLPILRIVALAYFLVCLGLFILDGRLAEPLSRLEVTRSYAQKLSLGAENPVSISVQNRGLRTRVFWLRDEPPDEFKIEARLWEGQAAPRQAWQGRYMVTPLRRGNYRFGDLHLRWLGPLGLLVRQARIPAAADARVYPNLLDVQRYDLLLRRNRLQEMGLRHSRQRGEGTEYERLREYLPDDDFRRIDWKATARRNRPITIEYETERSQNIFLAIDTGRMMLTEPEAPRPIEHIAKLDYVINSALLLTYVAIGKGDKVGLLTFADQVSAFLSPGQGKGQFYKALELLYAIRPQPVEPDYHTGLSYLALKQRKRALVVLFTDLSEGRSMEDLVRHAMLLQRTHLVLVVTIADPDVHAAAHQQPDNSLSAYQRAVAVQILDDRRLALDRLRQQGVLVLDAPATQLSTDVINRYLELKGETRL